MSPLQRPHSSMLQFSTLIKQHLIVWYTQYGRIQKYRQLHPFKAVGNIFISFKIPKHTSQYFIFENLSYMNDNLQV